MIIYDEIEPFHLYQLFDAGENSLGKQFIPIEKGNTEATGIETDYYGSYENFSGGFVLNVDESDYDFTYFEEINFKKFYSLIKFIFEEWN